MAGRLNFMPCSLASLASTLCSEQPELPSVTSLLTSQNYPAQASHALHSAGQPFPPLWFPKGWDHLLGAVFLYPAQPSV